MRDILLISGLPRLLKENFKSIVTLCSGLHNPAVYCHFWCNDDASANTINYFIKLMEQAEIEVHVVTESPLSPEDLIKLCQTKKDHKQIAFPTNGVSQFLSVKKAFNYAKNNCSDDIRLVFRTRSDLLCTNRILPLRNVKDKTVYLSYRSQYCGVADTFAFGNFESMELYCDFIEFIRENINLLCGSPEIVLAQYLYQTGARVEFGRFNYPYIILRQSNNNLKILHSPIAIERRHNIRLAMPGLPENFTITTIVGPFLKRISMRLYLPVIAGLYMYPKLIKHKVKFRVFGFQI